MLDYDQGNHRPFNNLKISVPVQILTLERESADVISTLLTLYFFRSYLFTLHLFQLNLFILYLFILSGQLRVTHPFALDLCTLYLFRLPFHTSFA